MRFWWLSERKKRAGLLLYIGELPLYMVTFEKWFSVPREDSIWFHKSKKKQVTNVSYIWPLGKKDKSLFLRDEVNLKTGCGLFFLWLTHEYFDHLMLMLPRWHYKQRPNRLKEVIDNVFICSLGVTLICSCISTRASENIHYLFPVRKPPKSIWLVFFIHINIVCLFCENTLPYS